MTGVFTDEIAFVKSELVNFGKSVIWRHVTDGTLPDTDKPWIPGDYQVDDYPVSIVFFPFNKEDRQTQKYPKDSEVSSGSVIGYLAGDIEFTPKLRDFVIDGSKQMKVTYINELAPNGETIIYYLELSY